MADKTATSDTFPSGGENYITQTKYRLENGTAVSGRSDGSTVDLWQQVSASDYGKLDIPDDEKLTTGSLSVTPDVASGGVTSSDTRKYYKLVGQYNTDGSKKWSTTASTTAELTNQMVDRNNGRPSDLLKEAHNSSEKAVAKQARISPSKAKDIINATTVGEQGRQELTRSIADSPVKKGTRNTPDSFGGDIMRYPTNMSQEQDKIKIDMIKFIPKKLNPSDSGFGDRREAGIKDIIGTVMLAIPGGIRDDNRVNWGSADMNAAQAKGAAIALEAIRGDGKGVASGLDELRKGIEDQNVRDAIAIGFAGAAVGAQGLLARTQGAVINPNTELLFNGPALRAFTFQFPFSPRSQAESVMVQRIIRFFKQGMAVQRTENAIFLKAPNVFQLKFVKGESNQHEFLPKIKVCALLNCSVDYTPDGNYSTYTNSSMTKYTMSLTFNELDPLFNDEYETEGEGAVTNNIGF